MNTIVLEDGAENHLNGQKVSKGKNQIYKRVFVNRKSIKASSLSHLISPQLICYNYAYVRKETYIVNFARLAKCVVMKIVKF